MIMLEEPTRPRAGRRRRRAPGALLVVLGLVFAFVVGIAFGRALDDNSSTGQIVTSVRTLTPLPQEPPARTVTVTVTTP